MKSYPSIPNHNKSKIPLGQPCIGFYKHDGSNLRWEWNKKCGWYKFGTRTRLFDETDEIFGEAIPLFLDTMADEIVSKTTSLYNNLTDFIVYTEFLGESSFAGQHVVGEEKELILFDVHIPRKGFIIPKEFIKHYNYDWVSPVVYQGNLNQKLINDVRDNIYGLHEGMMCKGVDSKNMQWMVKIKTKEYLDKLKNKFGDDWEKMV